jgi:hypothetical protein
VFTLVSQDTYRYDLTAIGAFFSSFSGYARGLFAKNLRIPFAELSETQKGLLRKGMTIDLGDTEKSAVALDFQFYVVANWKNQRFEAMIARAKPVSDRD